VTQPSIFRIVGIEVPYNPIIDVGTKVLLCFQYSKKKFISASLLSHKKAEKTKNVAFLLSNVKNIYYFCSRKIVKNIKLTQ